MYRKRTPFYADHVNETLNINIIYSGSIFEPFWHTLNPTDMFKNYLKIAWRNLFRNKVYSIINIAGLSIGMAMTLLIGLWITDEFSVNKNFAHYDRIVRVMLNSTHGGITQTSTALPVPVARELKTKYASDFKNVTVMTWADEHVLSYGNTKLLVTGGHYAEPDIIPMLSMKMIRGEKMPWIMWDHC